MVNHRAPGSIHTRQQGVRLPRRGVVIALLLLMTLVSCAGPARQARRPAAITPTVAAPTPTLPISYTNPAPVRTLAQAWGNVHITRIPSLLPNGEICNGSNVATPDGQWMICEIEPRDMLNNQTIYPQIGLYNITTRQIRVIRTLRSPQSRMGDLGTDGRWLAWSDAVDPDTFFDWVMYVCDLRTGAVRVLATAPRVNGRAAVGPHAGPLVSNGYAVWSQATTTVTPGNLSSLKNVIVQEEDLSSGVVTTLASSSEVESFSWPWLALDQISSTGAGAVVLRNLVTQQTLQLDDEPGSFKLFGTSAALDDNSTVISVIPDITTSLTPQSVFGIDPTRYIPLGTATLNDRLVAWLVDGGPPMPAVWDRVEHVTVMLPTTRTPPTWAAVVSGPLLIWLDPAESAAQTASDEQQGLSPLFTYCIVNTTTLPTTAPQA